MPGNEVGDEVPLHLIREWLEAYSSQDKPMFDMSDPFNCLFCQYMARKATPAAEHRAFYVSDLGVCCEITNAGFASRRRVASLPKPLAVAVLMALEDSMCARPISPAQALQVVALCESNSVAAATELLVKYCGRPYSDDYYAACC